MDFKRLLDYAEQKSDTEPELLAQLNRETHLKVLQPRMLSGTYQGRLLSMLSRMIQPRNILEIGTFTGYSALCLAEGLVTDGELYTIEVNDELSAISNKYFQLSPYGKYIKPIIGNALEVIPTLDAEFDLSFIDGEKLEYAHYYELVLQKTRPGGFLLVDNVFWSGKVTEKIDPKDHAANAIVQFNEMLKNDQRTSNIIIPIRDGLTLIQKNT